MVGEGVGQSRSRRRCVSQVEMSLTPSAKRFVGRIGVVGTTPCSKDSRHANDVVGDRCKVGGSPPVIFRGEDTVGAEMPQPPKRKHSSCEMLHLLKPDCSLPSATRSMRQCCCPPDPGKSLDAPPTMTTLLASPRADWRRSPVRAGPSRGPDAVPQQLRLGFDRVVKRQF